MGDVVKFRSREQRRHKAPPPVGAATTPNRPAPVYRAVDGNPIHWTDSAGTVHACEVTDAGRGIHVAWTICGYDVSDNAQYVANDLDEVTCEKCARWRWEPRTANDAPPPAWLPDNESKD